MKLNFFNNTMRVMAVAAISLFFSSGLITRAFADAKVAETGNAGNAATKASESDFKKLDSNGDGKISFQEAVKDKTLINVFDVADADHDGMVSLSEYLNYKSALSSMSKENTPSASL